MLLTTEPLSSTPGTWLLTRTWEIQVILYFASIIQQIEMDAHVHTLWTYSGMFTAACSYKAQTKTYNSKRMENHLLQWSHTRESYKGGKMGDFLLHATMEMILTDRCKQKKPDIFLYWNKPQTKWYVLAHFSVGYWQITLGCKVKTPGNTART